MITDATGAVVARYDYLPFGEPFNTSTVTNSIQFAGKEHDSVTGFDYFGARYFNAGFGRFVRSDDSWYGTPLDPQAMNRYSYVRNSPLTFVDPDGHQTVEATLNGAPAYGDLWRLFWENFLFGGPNDTNSKQEGRASSLQSRPLPDIFRCASSRANGVSVAALLPSGTPTLITNLLSNDVSSLSDFVFGPRRMAGATGFAEGKGLNLFVRAAGSIQYTADRFTSVGVRSSGTPYAEGLTLGTLANSSAGRLAGTVLKKASSVKVGYDVLTFVGSLGICATGY